MRQFAGFGTAEETNERFRYLLDHGQTGLSTAFDMPSLMGHDSDHARALGEVGREGVAIDSARRHADALSRHRPRRGLGVDDDQRAGGDHARLLRRRGRAAGRRRRSRSRGTIQADILKEYIAQKEWCFPIDPAMRLVGDMIEWCSRADAALAPGLDLRLPHPRGRIDCRAGARVHAQGRLHLRRAGASTAASTSTTSRRGCRSSSTPTSTSSRRSPSTAPRGASGRASCATPTAPSDPRSWLMRFHTQTAGVIAHRSAAAQQHRPHRDRGARRRARRHPVAAHQLLRRGARAAHRGSGADRAAHPADRRPRDRRRQHDRPARRQLLRRGADRRDGAPLPTSYFARIDELGGMVEAVKQKFPQREIADAAFELRRRSIGAPDRGRRQRVHRGRRRPIRRPCGSTPTSSGSRSIV